MSDTIYSQHHFMFPFRWDILPAKFKLQSIKENIAFDERTDLNDTLFNHLENWTHKSFELHNKFGDIDHLKYNEFTYFHDFVQKAVFDFEYPWKKKQQIMKYYEYDLDNAKDNKYLIEYLEKVNKDDWNCDKHETLQLELKLDGITLHFFNTGVGVLTYNLSNILESQKDKNSILKINEFGRRMYPQFIDKKGIEATQKAFLPKSITFIVNGNTLAIEDFSFYRLNNKALTVAEPYRLPTYIQNLFTNAVIFRLDETKLLEKQILITKVTDDRMFFHSWYGNDDLSKSFAKQKGTEDDWWYCYIFGDKAWPSIANNKMKAKQIKAHTYDRWLNSGTLFGMTRDSFVCLTDTGFYGSVLIRNHMNTMYYTLSVLCLAQRTSVLKFTAEVANLADLAKIDPDKKLIDNIKGVYKNYIEFINKLYFREITPQIQGIEIYNQFQKILNLENEIKDLDGEISELHEYVSLIQTERQNNNAAILNGIAMVFLPFTVVFGVLGANIFGENNRWHDFKKGDVDYDAIGGLIIGFGISIILIGLLFMTQYLIKKNKK